MRKIFELTTETIKVLNGSSDKVGEEYGCTGQYIRAILAGSETDPFAKFLSLFAASVRAGCNVAPWMDKLEGVKSRYSLSDVKCVRTETLEFVREANDVPVAAIAGKSLYEQLTEVNEALTKAERLKASLIQAINGEKDNGGSNRFSPRQYAHDEVTRRRGGR